MNFKGSHARNVEQSPQFTPFSKAIKPLDRCQSSSPREQFSVSVSMADSLPIKTIGSKWRADFYKLKWSRLEAVAKKLKTVIEECLPEAQLSLEGEFEAKHDKLASGIVIDLTNADPIQAEWIVQGFLMGVTGGNSTNQDDLFNNLEEKCKMIVNKHCGDFLDAHGNKNIRTPMQVSGSGLSYLITGKFADRPRPLPQKHDILRCLAKVNGFKKSTRTCYLVSTDGLELAVQFDLQFFLKEIGVAALAENLFEFSLQPRENEKGRLVYELTDIKDCP